MKSHVHGIGIICVFQKGKTKPPNVMWPTQNQVTL